jgi:Protein of unknown function (DUF982)
MHPAHLRMPDVRYRTKDGHPSVIRTVEEAIDYIDRNIGGELTAQSAFKVARVALHRSLKGEVPIGKARQVFVTALHAANMLIT